MSEIKAQIPEVKCGSPDKPLLIGDIEIPCYVLNNEKRVITQSGAVKALGMSEGTTGDRGARRIAKFTTGKRISPFVSIALQEFSLLDKQVFLLRLLNSLLF